MRQRVRRVRGAEFPWEVGVRMLLCVALLAVGAAHSWAEEGFFIADKPPAVQRLWPSVYAFVCEGRKDAYTATAFLVAKIDKDPPGTRRRMMADYYFVTAGHAIAACKRRKRYLAENLNEPEFEEDGITVRRRAARFSGAKSVYVDDTYDLAVVKVTAAADARVGRPVKVGGQCDRALKREVYAIGFPGVENRRSLKMKRETKRWSRGVFVGLGKADFQEVEAIYFAATVDSLPGSSGGPVIDRYGMLVGVVAKGASGPDNKFRYTVNPNDPLDWQTFLAPCDAVLRILQRAGLQ